MSDRGRGISRGRAAPGPSRGGRPTGPSSSEQNKNKREAILDLSKYVNERIRVKFTGGREVTGILKGYDQLLNLVVDDVEEVVNEPAPPHTRSLGLAVLRGPTVTLVSPVDGSEEIANPFIAQE